MKQAKRPNMQKKITSIFLVLAVLVAMVSLTGCEAAWRETQPMDFSVTLTQQDVDDTVALIKQLEEYIENKNQFKILSAAQQLQEKQDYIVHQYFVSEVKYYSDLENEDAFRQYVFAEEAHMTVREESQRVLKMLYNSNLLVKRWVFANWTEQALKSLEVSSEEVIALEKQQQELEREYLALEDPESESWSKALEEIYFRFVKSGQQLAEHYGYENYYEYAASEIYMRPYTKAQREAFRKIVKEQIVPLDSEINEQYQAKRALLTEAQKEQFSALRKGTCTEENTLLTGYMDSFPEKMQTIMHHLFDREAIVYTQSENAHLVAYTNYSDYCRQPFVLLGQECQDLLTLVHELGHYCAFYHFPDALLPYDTAEVHSQGNEWLMLQYLDGKIDPEVYEVFLLWRLRSGLDTIIISSVVDEYEEAVYTSEIADPDVFREIMEQVLDRYAGIEEIDTADGFYTYAQYVTIESPVYYLSYATSELAAMTFYIVAEEESYEKAQEIYEDLCLNTEIGKSFFDTLLDVGLPDPFDANTVVRIKNAFEDVLAEERLLPAA